MLGKHYYCDSGSIWGDSDASSKRNSDSTGIPLHGPDKLFVKPPSIRIVFVHFARYTVGGFVYITHIHGESAKDGGELC